MNNKFSVLISIYNYDNPTYLRHSLDSILYQSTIPDQVVMVIDGPINNLLTSEVDSFAYKYNGIFTKVELVENMGLGFALNSGLKHCLFDIVARMDSDDISFENRFELQLNYLVRNPNISILGTSISEFDKIPGDLTSIRRLPTNYLEILKFAKFRNPINHPTVMFRKSDILKIGSYSHMLLFEDYFLWVRAILSKMIIVNLDLPLLYFRVGNNMVSRRNGWSYLIKELTFLFKIYDLGFLNLIQLLCNLVIKVPLRLLPTPLLRLFYNRILRKY